MSVTTPGQPGAKNFTAEPVTYEEFLALPEEFKFTEWVDGKVVPMAPVSDEHSKLSVFLISILAQFVQAHDVGEIRSEPFQMKTGPELPGRSPDVFIVFKKNAGRIKTTYLEGPADLVVEIISPDSRGRDRGDKYFEYEQGGVPEYWLIDPERKQAEFYVLGGDGFYHMVPAGADGVFRSAVIEGLWVKVEWFWTRPSYLDVYRAWGLV